MWFRKHILIYTLIIVLVIIGTSWIHAAENKPAMNYSSISGVVKDSETGLPIENVAIKLDYYLFDDELESVDFLEMSTQTDPNGTFTFTQLSTDHINYYDLYFSHDSYFSEFEWGGFDGSADINLEIELNPEKYGTVAGIVTDPEGNPLADVEVRTEWNPDTERVSEKTNADGEFTLEKVLFGNHALYFRHILYETICEEVNVEENKTTTIDAQFTKEREISSISGTVKDSETGLTVENVAIKLDYYLFDDGGFEPVDILEMSTQTDANGTFTFTQLPSGHSNDYDLYFSHDSYFSELVWGGFNGSDDINLEIELNPEKYGTVAGIVTDPEGNPLADVEVRTEWNLDTGHVSEKTNADGEFTLEKVLFGNHALYFRHILYETVYEEVNIEENKTTTLDAQFTKERELSSISGVVKDSETGLPIENVAIKLEYYLFDDNEFEPVDSLEMSTQTEANGTFTITQLPSGHSNYYDLYFSHESYFSELEWDGFNGSADINLEIELKVKEVEEIRYGYVLDNQNITVADAIAVLRHIVGLNTLDEDQQKRAKVSSGDGDITVQDAIIILRYVVGLITELPVSARH